MNPLNSKSNEYIPQSPDSMGESTFIAKETSSSSEVSSVAKKTLTQREEIAASLELKNKSVQRGVVSADAAKAKEIALAAVKQDGNALQHANPELKRDKEVVLAAVKQDGNALCFADPELKRDKEVVLTAVIRNGYALCFADPELKRDKEVVLTAIQQDVSALYVADPELKRDKEVVLAAVELNGYALKYADPELKRDKKVVLAAVRQNHRALKYADPELKKDNDIALAVVQQYGCALEHLDPELKKDKEVVLAAVRQNRSAFQYADTELKKDKEVILAAVKLNGYALEHLDPELKKDKEIILAAVKLNGYALEHADTELKRDKEVVLAAVKQNGYALKFADNDLKKDKEVVLAAVELNSSALHFAAPELTRDKEVVLAAVKLNSSALQYADNELKKDKTFVLAAVKLNGSALQYADNELKKDRTFVLAAVKQNSHALQYADTVLKKDKKFILTAIKLNAEALQYVDTVLKKDKTFVLAAVKLNSGALYFADPELKEDKEFILSCLDNNSMSWRYANDELRTDFVFVRQAISSIPSVLLYVDPITLISRNRINEIDPIETPARSLIKNSVMKIRKSNIQFFLFSIADFIGEEQINKLLKKEGSQKSYPTYLQALALCLRTRLPDGEIGPYLQKFEGGRLKQLIKNQSTGVQEALVKLLIEAPCLRENEIHSFFNNLPTDSEQLRIYIARVSNFISLASETERENLPEILQDINHRNERLSSPCIALISKFVPSASLTNLDPIILNPISDQLFSYLILHESNEELHADLSRLLEAIIERTFPEERYLPKSAHLEKLQYDHPNLFQNWKTLSSHVLQTSLEEDSQGEVTFNLQTFFQQKLGDGHLHRDLTQAIKTNTPFSDPLQNSCLDLLNGLMSRQRTPSQEEIDELKKILREAALSTDEFEHDLDSLIQKETKLSTLEIADRWEDLLCSGIEGSCQRIDGNPDLNKCLLAYVLDGKNQMLCVKNPEGKIVGRSILRLLFREDDTPCIFVERFYGNPKVEQAIQKGAEEISRELNLELYKMGSGPILRSIDSSVSFEYSDASKGVTNGAFEHQGCLVESPTEGTSPHL